MKFQSPPKKTAYGDQLIPMINVVFLLLIFFMIAGTMRAPTPEGITAPSSEGFTPTNVGRTLYVDKDGRFILDNNFIDVTALNQVLSEDEWFSDLDNEALPVLFDRAMTMEVFAKTMDQLRSTSASKIELITEFGSTSSP